MNLDPNWYPPVRWDRIPAVASETDARAWLTFQAYRGLAMNTLEAYGRYS